jgi:hypothetical protein
MNNSPQDWEEQMRVGLGHAPPPDFKAWCARHPDAVAALRPVAAPVQATALQTPINRRYLMTSFKWLAASVLIVGGWLWLGSGTGNLGENAFADAIPGVDGVQTMTWTVTYYTRIIGEDGKKTWLEKERRLRSYRHPGLHRESFLDEKGAVMRMHITDVRAGRMLDVDVKEKKAVLKVPVVPYDERPPFAYVGDMIRERKTGSESTRITSLSLQGQKEIDSKKANVVRAITASSENGGKARIDFLFGETSKQLVGVWAPNELGIEFDVAADEEIPADEKWQKRIPLGALYHELVLGPKLEASDFSLDPPVDYAFEKQIPATVTEDEMIAYLGAAARFNDNQFPDSPYQAFDSDKFNASSEKKMADRSPAEQALIDIRDKIMMREIYRSPVKQFEDDHTVPKSFHYVGSGVKVGQADRIVSWYKLRKSSKYQALYGDLSTREVNEKDLPLRLSE